MPFDAWPLLAAPAVREPLVPLWVMEWTASFLLHLWLFCVGACVGSFLNVVVYRLPRGRSLSHPGSCCPHCGQAIRLNDNVPILSWLWLRGRCRDCHAPIAARYLWVELLVASMFLAVAFWERNSWAGTFGWFPLRHPQLGPQEAWPYWSRYAIHVVELTTLIGGVLMLADGFRPPVRLFLPAILLTAVLAFIWPQVGSVPGMNYGSLPPWWLPGACDASMGSGSGLYLPILAVLLYMARLAPHSLAFVRSLPAMPAWAMSVGLVLGWQRTLLYGAPILIVYLLAGESLRRRRPRANAIDQPTTDSPTTDSPTSDQPTSDLTLPP